MHHSRFWFNIFIKMLQKKGEDDQIYNLLIYTNKNLVTSEEGGMNYPFYK